MIQASYPLSPLQQGMLFHALYAPGSGVDIEQIIGALAHPVDAEALDRAWQRVIAFYPVLRTAFRWRGLDQPVQEVHAQAGCPLERMDWRALSAAEQQTRLDELIGTDRLRGFDLGRLPLMRLVLVQFGEADYRLIWTFHHILMDGRSFAPVLTQVFDLYDAFHIGRDLELAPSRPFGDYIEWLQSVDWSKTASFWRELLRGFRTPNSLVVARAAQPASGHGWKQTRLPAAITYRLKSIAEEQGLSLNTLVQGAWALLLHRYGGERDVVFGAVRACRRSAFDGLGAEGMIGLFVNTVPVRAQVRPEDSLLSLLKALRREWITLRDYEHTPLYKIQEWSETPRGSSLFSSLLVFERDELNTLLRAQGGEWEKREFTLLEQTNYPLTAAGYGESELVLRLEYERPRLDDATVERMLGHWRTLFEGFAAGLNRRIADLSLLTEPERRELVVDWNNTRVDTGPTKLIYRRFEARSRETPDALAVIAGNQQLTYRELNERANQLAHFLVGMGVGPEVRVGIYLDRSVEMLVALLGILKAGGAFVALDPAHPPARLAYILSDTHAPVILTRESLFASFPAYDARLICLDVDWPVVAQYPGDNLPPRADLNNLAYIIYTSGSTGQPKGTMLSFRSLDATIQVLSRAYVIQPGDRVLQFASLTFDTSLEEIMPCLTSGATLVLRNDEMLSSTQGFMARCKDWGITVLDLPTAYWHELAHAGLSQSEIPDSLRLVIIGGERAQPERLAEWREHVDPRVNLINTYGPTETTIIATMCQPFEMGGGAFDSIIPIGRPIGNVRVYILDGAMQPVPIGVPGELYIGGNGLARGYFHRADLTAARFIPDPFSGDPGTRLYRTGDLCRYLLDGNIEFLGRTDLQVKVRGFRVELEEIEAALRQHPSVQEAVVTLWERPPDSNKQLVAYFVAAREPAPTPAELRRFLSSRLPDYMLPAFWTRLPRMPLNGNGKIDRQSLPAPDLSRRVEGPLFVGPRTPTEEHIAQTWATILGISRVDVNENFFELGGNSLLATRVVSHLRADWNIDLPVRALFEWPSVATLARYIETYPASPRTDASIIGEREELSL
ncbi:MAG: amino acid adenylation domain-containing protein [Anaerolineae bacterium]